MPGLEPVFICGYRSSGVPGGESERCAAVLESRLSKAAEAESLTDVKKPISAVLLCCPGRGMGLVAFFCSY